MTLLAIEAPHGPALRFALVALVIVAMPVLVERLRIPGMVGLLAGGVLIGPYVTGWIESTDTDVPSLGQLGLLYLMFAAGVELDRQLFRAHRRAAVAFSLMTFAVPQLFGLLLGLALGWSAAAALLLGSLFASHTLVVYPAVREAGLARDPAVAATVGATIITDTLALIVLAVVAGTQTGDASTAAVVLELAIGFAVLCAVALVAVPRAVRWAFRTVATDRNVRFVVVLASFLVSAVVGEVFGIEAIVGAFFAGLGLNGVIPAGSVLMERLEFFGSSFLVPTFLVSVGLLVDPAVMVQPATLGLGLLFCVACLGGKAVAAALTRPALGFTGAQSGVVFALSSPQAAATLAAAFVGFEIGLFGERVVNAILVVVVVSLVVAPAAARWFGTRVPTPAADESAIGRRVLVPVVGEHAGPALVALAGRLAERDAGVLVPLHVAARGTPRDVIEREVEHAESMIATTGLDAEVVRRADDDLARALVNAAKAERATLVVAGWDAVALGRWRDTVETGAEDDAVPALVASLGAERVERVVVVLQRHALGRSARPARLVTAEIASRLRAGGTPVVLVSTMRSGAERLARLAGADEVARAASTIDWVAANGRPGDLVVVPLTRSWEAAVAEAGLLVGRPELSVGIVTPASSGTRSQLASSALRATAEA